MRVGERVAGERFDVTDRQSHLMNACLASFRQFYLPEAGILAGIASWNGSTWTQSEPSPENTANALIALYELRRHGIALPVDPDPMMDRMMVEYFHGLNYVTLASLLWADAIGNRRYDGILWNALRARLPADVSQTMQLGWTLSAISNYASVAGSSVPVVRMAGEIYQRIVANQSKKSGLFFASGARQGWLRQRLPLSSLSSQTYPIQGLALYGRVFGVPEALERAQRCAAAICRQQGAQGQWWWRYNVDTGAVAEKYPVFSVNQDTAIPMALGELQRALGLHSYSAAIDKGLGWLFGENELGRSLVDEATGVIWRAIRPRDSQFELVSEMHSYHAARCLYNLCATQAI